MQHYIAQSLAPTTRSSYETGVRRWQAHCKYNGRDPEEIITVAHVEEWFADMADEGKVSVGTLRVYRSALSAHHVQRTSPSTLSTPNPLDHPRIDRLLRGIDRVQMEKRMEQSSNATATALTQKTPGVTVNMILALITRFNKGSDTELMNTAAAALAVAAALRPSELLGSRKTPNRALQTNQLQFYSDPDGLHEMTPAVRGENETELSPDHCVLTLRVGKTNQRRRPQVRFIGMSAVVDILWKWRIQRLTQHIDEGSESNAELFRRRGFQPLRTGTLLRFLETHLPRLDFPHMNHLTGKAFRIGGASSLAAVGAPAVDISAMGGWAPSANTWKRYASEAAHRDRALLTQRNLQQRSITALSRIRSSTPRA